MFKKKFKSKDEFRKRTEEILIRTLEKEEAEYDSLELSEKTKASARIALLSDKVQKLDNNAVSETTADKELLAKREMIVASSVLTIGAGIVAQRNRKWLRDYEVDHVVRGETGKSIVKGILNFGMDGVKVIKKLF